ncbi:MAG: hypothetical protein ABFE01_00245 [Phycisphaerales bacterium]
MAVSQQDAAESLDLIHQATARTRRAVSAAYAGNLLILWGLIWIAGFGAMHFSPHRGWVVFAGLDGLGIIGTLLICRKWPVRALAGGGISAAAGRMLVLGLVLLVYAGLWVLLLRPISGILLGTFLATIVMLGYVVIGLWSGSAFMTVLGLAVTGLTLLGYFAFRGYFNLWMAATGGGALLGAGLYVRSRWR